MVDIKIDKNKIMNLDMDSVPSSLGEALQVFISSLDKDEIKTLKDVGENDLAVFHHSWGQDIRNMWSMWEENTPLVNDFKSLDITHADDMSSIILTSTWRKIHKKPIKLKEQISNIHEYWKKEIGKICP